MAYAAEIAAALERAAGDVQKALQQIARAQGAAHKELLIDPDGENGRAARSIGNRVGGCRRALAAVRDDMRKVARDLRASIKRAD